MKKRTEFLRLSVGIIAGLIGALVNSATFWDQYSRSPTQADAQIEKIQRVNDELRDLIQFFEGQQRKVSRNEKIVEKLRLEEKNLRPLIDANRETIEAVLNAQAEKQKQTIWIDRFIGFLFGIGGSLIASVIWSRFQRSREQEKPSDD